VPIVEAPSATHLCVILTMANSGWFYFSFSFSTQQKRRNRSQFTYAKEALSAASAGSYWMSAHRRIKSQFVVWQDLVGKDFILGRQSTRAGTKTSTTSKASKSSKDLKLGVILPRLITAGTVTRRAVESTWLTASNPKKNRIGSELKSKVWCSCDFVLAVFLTLSGRSRHYQDTALWAPMLTVKNYGFLPVCLFLFFK
jgi:hypothetical protein